MNQNKFDINKFKPFRTSSGLDGNFTGLYEDKLVRVIKRNNAEYKDILNFSDQLNDLVKSKLFYDDENFLVVEHEKLTNITYFTEWTKKQKVAAAKTVVNLQSKLVGEGYYLNDPHAFNITFKYHQPIYFDFGSIRKGKITPSWWFIKCFCGWTEMDYWDSVLKINRIHKIWIAFRMGLSQKPYEYLGNKLTKFEFHFAEKKIINLLNKKGFIGRLTRKVVNALPFIFNNFSNWTDYEQKIPALNFDNERNKNILELFRKIKPQRILDIGANKGVFSFLALDNGVEEAIALDLDNYSLDFLFNEAKKFDKKITIARLNIMSYPDKPGYYQSYFPAHERLNSDFTICLAVVHHVCYFGNFSFEELAERLNRFATKILIVEFVPYDDAHLTGPIYKGKDRSWYTLENFISAMKTRFPNEHKIFPSTPSPRMLIKFSK